VPIQASQVERATGCLYFPSEPQVLEVTRRLSSGRSISPFHLTSAALCDAHSRALSIGPDRLLLSRAFHSWSNQLATTITGNVNQKAIYSNERRVRVKRSTPRAGRSTNEDRFASLQVFIAIKWPLGRLSARVRGTHARISFNSCRKVSADLIHAALLFLYRSDYQHTSDGLVVRSTN